MIKLAVIGTNWITDKFIEGAILTQKYELIAVYSRDQQKAQTFAQKYGAPLTFTDLNKLAQSKSIDAVYIASPNSLHFEQSKLMLENGKDVICEKPLASNITQTKEIVRIAKQHNQIIFEALKTYYLPNFEQVRTYLSKIGKLRKVFLNYCQYSSRYPRYLNGENPNTFNPEFSNGSVMDIGIYPINFSVALWGKPERLHADAYLLPSGVDGHGVIVMNYADFDVTIFHSKVSDSSLPSEIQGEDGSLMIENLSVGERVFFKPRQGEIEDISLTQVTNEMSYEANIFAQLIAQREIDHAGLTYSLTSSALLTEIRNQTGVCFPSDLDK